MVGMQTFFLNLSRVWNKNGQRNTNLEHSLCSLLYLDGIMSWKKFNSSFLVG